MKEARFDPGFLYSRLLLLLLVGLRRVLAALLTTLLAALILLARLLVALRIRLSVARLVLVGHESLFSEKDLKKDFSGTHSIWVLEGCITSATPPILNHDQYF
ncbi:MAG TPA: hypothetical protein VFO36_04485 [Nitrospiraceae bacterium]|nr:hypothetical protein [Nitrospiraceae bacterium]